MSTGPTEQTPRPTYGYSPGASMDWGRLPLPFNSELVVFVIVIAVISIAALVENDYNIPQWVDAVVLLTAAYLISRGIAKASRVLEQ